jgi:transposase-like protein
MKRHTDQEIKHALETLELNRGNQTKTAKELGIDRTLLNKWKQRVAQNPDILDAEAPQESELDRNTRKTLEGLKTLQAKAIKRAIEKIDGSSASQAAVIAAISTDKINLLSGKPTSRNESVRVRYAQPDDLKNAAANVVPFKRRETA